MLPLFLSPYKVTSLLPSAQRKIGVHRRMRMWHGWGYNMEEKKWSWVPLHDRWAPAALEGGRLHIDRGISPFASPYLQKCSFSCRTMRAPASCCLAQVILSFLEPHSGCADGWLALLKSSCWWGQYKCMRESNSKHSFLWEFSGACPQSQSRGSDWFGWKEAFEGEGSWESILTTGTGMPWGLNLRWQLLHFRQWSMGDVYVQPRDPLWAEFWEEGIFTGLWDFPGENLA